MIGLGLSLDRHTRLSWEPPEPVRWWSKDEGIGSQEPSESSAENARRSLTSLGMKGLLA